MKKVKVRMFIEVLSNHHPSGSMDAYPCLMLLNELIERHNAPPDFVGALQAIFQHSKITKDNNKSISIVDKEFGPSTADPMARHVSVVKFEGTLEGLFLSLRDQGVEITYQPNLVILNMENRNKNRSRKENIKVTINEFSGSLRDLVCNILNGLSDTASYFAKIESSTSVYIDVFCIGK